MDKTSSNPATDDGEAGRVKALDDRFGALEAEQERQGGLLEQIAAKLGGGKPDSDGPVTSADAPPAGPNPADMAEQMRQAVRDVRAEEAQADADRQHAADHAKLSAPEPEKTPREVMIKGKAKLQKVLFGGDGR